jgi:hypothetical protein
VDAVVVGFPAALGPLVLAALSWRDSIALLGLVPIVASIGAVAVRSGAPKTFGAAGRCIVIATPVAIAVGVWPALSLATLALTPVALRWAAQLEMTISATAWVELQHDAAGDPYWLSRL